MSVRFSYDKNKKVLYGVIDGELTLKEYKDAMQELVSSEGFAANTRTLWDLRKLSFKNIDRNFEKQMIEILRSLPDRGDPNVACVVNDDLGFGMGRMFEFLSDELPQDIRVFRDYGKADEWVQGTPIA